MLQIPSPEHCADDNPRDRCGHQGDQGSLHRAIELLEKAEQDSREEMDNAFAKDLKKRAIFHIHEAIRFTREGLLHAKRR